MNRILANPLLLTATLITIAVLAVILIVTMTNQPSLNDGATVTVRVDKERVNAKVAAESPTQAKGLGGTEPLTDEEGMLFVYDPAVIPTFVMRGMTYPIDIIWINDDTVTDVTANVQPEPNVADEDLKKYNPPGPVDRVLEVKAGFAAANGIQPGDPFKISSF